MPFKSIYIILHNQITNSGCYANRLILLAKRCLNKV